MDFATDTLKKHSDEEARLVFVVNRVQAYKWIGDEETAQRIIGAEDWSATSDKFRLAKAVLTNDFRQAAIIMRGIGANSLPSKSDYRDWPLFKAYRKSDEFLQAFEDVFGETYTTFEKEGSAFLDEAAPDIFRFPAEPADESGDGAPPS